MLSFQTTINEKLNNVTLESLPKSLLLVGQEGCGRHLLIKEMSDKLGIESVNITDSLSFDELQRVYECPIIKLYFIECDGITEKQQNQILKLLEEPPKTAFLALLSTNVNTLLDTILNRCEKWVFERYTASQLMTFTQDLELAKIAETPGQILAMSGQDFNHIQTLCEKIYTVIQNATVPNTLSISDMIGWKGEQDKLNKHIFYKCLINKCTEKVAGNKAPMKAYTETRQLVENSEKFPRADQKRLFENFLLRLKNIMQVYFNDSTAVKR